MLHNIDAVDFFILPLMNSDNKLQKEQASIAILVGVSYREVISSQTVPQQRSRRKRVGKRKPGTLAFSIRDRLRSCYDTFCITRRDHYISIVGEEKERRTLTDPW